MNKVEPLPYAVLLKNLLELQDYKTVMNEIHPLQDYDEDLQNAIWAIKKCNFGDALLWVDKYLYKVEFKNANKEPRTRSTQLVSEKIPQIKATENQSEKSESLVDADFEDSSDHEESTYSDYQGSYAQDVEGYDDQTINDAFDGNPDNYWNID